MACHTPPLKKNKVTKRNAITSLLYLSYSNQSGYSICGIYILQPDLLCMHTVSSCVLEKGMVSLLD